MRLTIAVVIACFAGPSLAARDHWYIKESGGTYSYVSDDSRGPLQVRFRGRNRDEYVIEYLGEFGSVSRITCQAPCHIGRKKIYINNKLDNDAGDVDLDAWGPVSAAIDDMLESKLKVSARPWSHSNAQIAPYILGQ